VRAPRAPPTGAATNSYKTAAALRHRALPIDRCLPHIENRTYQGEKFMQRIVRALGCGALVSSLAACVVPQQQTEAPRLNPHEMAVQRLEQVDGRVNAMNRRVDTRVNQGYYPPPAGAELHHRLDTVRHEAHDMAAQHGGGLSGDEQRVLNQELDAASAAVNR
jgi:hypothetical protein